VPGDLGTETWATSGATLEATSSPSSPTISPERLRAAESTGALERVLSAASSADSFAAMLDTDDMALSMNSGMNEPWETSLVDGAAEQQAYCDENLFSSSEEPQQQPPLGDAALTRSEPQDTGMLTVTTSISEMCLTRSAVPNLEPTTSLIDEMARAGAADPLDEDTDFEARGDQLHNSPRLLRQYSVYWAAYDTLEQHEQKAAAFLTQPARAATAADDDIRDALREFVARCRSSEHTQGVFLPDDNAWTFMRRASDALHAVGILTPAQAQTLEHDVAQAEPAAWVPSLTLTEPEPEPSPSPAPRKQRSRGTPGSERAAKYVPAAGPRIAKGVRTAPPAKTTPSSDPYDRNALTWEEDQWSWRHNLGGGSPEEEDPPRRGGAGGGQAFMRPPHIPAGQPEWSGPGVRNKERRYSYSGICKPAGEGPALRCDKCKQFFFLDELGPKTLTEGFLPHQRNYSFSCAWCNKESSGKSVECFELKKPLMYEAIVDAMLNMMYEHKRREFKESEIRTYLFHHWNTLMFGWDPLVAERSPTGKGKKFRSGGSIAPEINKKSSKSKKCTYFVFESSTIMGKEAYRRLCHLEPRQPMEMLRPEEDWNDTDTSAIQIVRTVDLSVSPKPAAMAAAGPYTTMPQNPAAGIDDVELASQHAPWEASRPAATGLVLIDDTVSDHRDETVGTEEQRGNLSAKDRLVHLDSRSKADPAGGARTRMRTPRPSASEEISAELAVPASDPAVQILGVLSERLQTVIGWDALIGEQKEALLSGVGTSARILSLLDRLIELSLVSVLELFCAVATALRDRRLLETAAVSSRESWGAEAFSELESSWDISSQTAQRQTVAKFVDGLGEAGAMKALRVAVEMIVQKSVLCGGEMP
jgi:hypothetical protein